MLVSCMAGCAKKLTIGLGGGVLPGEAKDMESLLKMTPTRNGYEFAGWYADASYTEYMTSSSLSKNQEKAGEAYAKWIKVEEKTYDVRTETFTIADGNKKNNQYDVVYLSDAYDLTDLKRAGYTELEVVLTMKVHEISDGTEYVYFYKNENVLTENKSVIGWLDKNLFGNEKEDPDLLSTQSFEFELDEGEEDEVFGEQSVKTRIKISDLEKNLVIRYAAAGSWENRDVTLTVTPKK